MSSFTFLFILMLVGILLWVACDPKFPKASKAGFIMFVVTFASICYGTHPILPPWIRG
jgi:hypothetical protein